MKTNPHRKRMVLSPLQDLIIFPLYLPPVMGQDEEQKSPRSSKPSRTKQQKKCSISPSNYVEPAMRTMLQNPAKAKRYEELLQWLDHDSIRNLKIQPEFTVQESFIDPNGQRVPAIRYTADFSYEKKSVGISSLVWTLVVEEVKDRIEQIPQKTVQEQAAEKYGIKITEV